jgi:hypothetical protein
VQEPVREQVRVQVPEPAREQAREQVSVLVLVREQEQEQEQVLEQVRELARAQELCLFRQVLCQQVLLYPWQVPSLWVRRYLISLCWFLAACIR